MRHKAVLPTDATTQEGTSRRDSARLLWELVTWHIQTKQATMSYHQFSKEPRTVPTERRPFLLI